MRVLYFNPLGTWANRHPIRSWELDAVSDGVSLTGSGARSDANNQNAFVESTYRLLYRLRNARVRQVLAGALALMVTLWRLPLLNRFDAVVILGPGTARLVSIAKWVARYPKGQIFEVRFRDTTEGSPWPPARVQRLTERGLEAVIVVSRSQSTAEDSQKKRSGTSGRAPRRFLLSGIDTNFWDSTPLGPRPLEEPYLIVVGGAERDDRLVSELARTGTTRIVRVCGNAAVRRWYEELFRAEPQLRTVISVVDGATNHELRAWYQHAVAALLPMRDVPEPVGQTVMFESLACGCPVITNHLHTYEGLSEEAKRCVQLVDGGLEPLIKAISRHERQRTVAERRAMSETMRNTHSLAARNSRLLAIVRDGGRLPDPRQAQ